MRLLVYTDGIDVSVLAFVCDASFTGLTECGAVTESDIADWS